MILKEILDERKYGHKGTVAIAESTSFILAHHQLSEEVIKLLKLDTRILSLMTLQTNKDIEIDHLVVVYDYREFRKEEAMSDAIIFHEIGHIEHGTELVLLQDASGLEEQFAIEAECDLRAIHAGCTEGLEKVLYSALHIAKALRNDWLYELTARRMNFLRSNNILSV